MKIFEPHHDGSELYVSNSAPHIGESVELSLRVPIKDKSSRVFVRFFHDGEPRTLEMKIKINTHMKFGGALNFKSSIPLRIIDFSWSILSHIDG